MTHDIRFPAVYVTELGALPKAVVEVETAVPVFVGYTEKATDGIRNVLKQPVRLRSMHEFEATFGSFHRTQLDVKAGTMVQNAELQYGPAPRFLLHHCMQLFFDNGGGPCHVLSVGDYTSPIVAEKLWDAEIASALEQERGPTLIVIPESTQVGLDGWRSISQSALAHCNAMQSRMTILDVVGGDKGNPNGLSDQALIQEHSANFRTITADNLSFGVAYYPWLVTTILSDADVDFRFLSKAARTAVTAAVVVAAASTYVGQPATIQAIGNAVATIDSYDDAHPPTPEALAAFLVQHQLLLAAVSFYRSVMDVARALANLLPPSAAMAGVYARVDSTKGVFKAPANIELTSAVDTALPITDAEQSGLNVPPDGKAINAIRMFPGRGPTVWGARTLDGNSGEWRYVNVRRTMIMFEQSIKNALQGYVFEPNTAATWVAVRAMIENYLTSKWRDGALVGAKPQDAFVVNVGLGSTMTGNDILNGVMRVNVLVAMMRPAEFIVFAIEQRMPAPD
jgi:phage tail sheath protein FI